MSALRVAFVLLHDVVEQPLLDTYSSLYYTGRLEVFTVAKSRNAVQTQAELAITPHWSFSAHPPCEVVVLGGGWQCYQKARRDKVLRRYLEQFLTPSRVVIAIEEAVLLLGTLDLLRERTVLSPTLTEQNGYHDLLLGFEPAQLHDNATLVQDGKLWSLRAPQAAPRLTQALLDYAEHSSGS